MTTWLDVLVWGLLALAVCSALGAVGAMVWLLPQIFDLDEDA